MEKTVRDLMHAGVIACRPDATLGQVAVMLNQNHVHSLVVTDRDGRSQGIITDFDLLAGEWLSADQESMETMRNLTAGDLMSSPINTIEASFPASEAARRMLDEDISRLLVLDRGKRVGILSVSDFVAELAEAAALTVHAATVADVMSDAILVCRDRTPIALAARTMTQIGWRSVLVVDAYGKPLGQVSGLDLLPYCVDKDPEGVLVADVMHPALTIPITASLRQAVDTMIENHYHRLVVIDPEEPESMPLGVISSFDIVAEMARPGSFWQK